MLLLRLTQCLEVTSYAGGCTPVNEALQRVSDLFEVT